jgi:hypothetical protein
VTIRHQDQYLDSSVDWAILSGCFGTSRIEPSDIDGWVERGGISLFLERKLPEGSLKGGQIIGHKSLASQGNTVITFWAANTPEGPEVRRLKVNGPGHDGMVRPATLADLREVVCDWYRQADARRGLTVTAFPLSAYSGRDA